jgi:tRNA (guanine-N7-)-methyltransferase
MVRERVNNRDFNDRFIVPVPPGTEPLPLPGLYPASAPLEVDIGCGRGRFLLARAQALPDLNFLGIDRCTLRLKKIDRRAEIIGLTNIRLMQGDAIPLLARLPEGSTSTVYVFFPDPWPKRRHHPRRLVSPQFIDLVFRALSPGGVIHLCTDHTEYYSAILKHWRSDSRFRECDPFIPTEEEETDFGLIFRSQGKSANRCSFRKD